VICSQMQASEQASFNTLLQVMQNDSLYATVRLAAK
jgi:hypothetical protein